MREGENLLRVEELGDPHAKVRDVLVRWQLDGRLDLHAVCPPIPEVVVIVVVGVCVCVCRGCSTAQRW